MLTEKQQRQRAQMREHYRQLLCTKCGSIMSDCEPGSGKGEFWHPKNNCANSNKIFTWGTPPDRRRFNHIKRHGKRVFAEEAVSGIVQMNYSSRERRARRRGAKLASKHRPK